MKKGGYFITSCLSGFFTSWFRLLDAPQFATIWNSKWYVSILYCTNTPNKFILLILYKHELISVVLVQIMLQIREVSFY